MKNACVGVLSIITLRLFLGPGDFPVPWVPGVISPWVKRLRLEGDL